MSSSWPRRNGVRPLGQVMGSTVYHVGWQFQPTYQSTELVTMSHAQRQARHLALGRLQQEAKLARRARRRRRPPGAAGV